MSFISCAATLYTVLFAVRCLLSVTLFLKVKLKSQLRKDLPVTGPVLQSKIQFTKQNNTIL